MKKIIALVLALACVFAVAGCKKETAGVSNDGTVKLLWYVFGDKQADYNMVMEQVNKKLKEKLNVELQVTMIDYGSFENKVGLAISANEPFDMCFTSNWLNKYVPNVLKGAYLPLDDLIEKYAPKLKEVIPEMLTDVAKYQGKTYAIPNYQVCFGQYGFIIQKELIEKYNLDLSSINKTADIEPFLRKIKDNEPNLIPVRTQSYDMFRAIYEEIDPVPVYVKMNDKDLKAVARVDAPEAKETIAFMADWFKKGFVRKDFLTVTDDSVDVQANRYAVQIAGLKPGIEGEMYLKTKKEYVTKAIQEPYINALSGISAMTAISKNSKNPEKAIQLIELLNTDKEIFNMLLFGLEGKHYEKIGPEQVKVFEDAGYKCGSAAWEFGNQFNAYYMDTQTPGIWEETDKMNREAKISLFRGFMFDTEPIKTELAQIMAVQKEYDDDKLFARTDWEQAFEAKKQKIKLAGIDKVTAEAQKQLNEFKAKKGN